MSWLGTVGVAFLTAIIGAFGTGGLGILYVEWYRVPSREGASGYMVIFLGLLGGVLGFLIGIIGSRIVAAGTNPSFGRGLGMTAATCVGLLAVATFICWLLADFDTTLHGRPVEMQAEMRCAAGFVLVENLPANPWYTCMGTDTRRTTSYGVLRLKEARQEAGRWIIPTTLRLETSAMQKNVCFSLGEKTQWFRVAFPAKPGARYFEWSEWLPGIEEVGKPKPSATEGFNFRYRLAIVPEEKPAPEVPPGPTEQEVLEKAKAADTAALAALSGNSSIEECLLFTQYTRSEENRAQAGAVIAKRPNVVAEMTAQILSPDPDISGRALRAFAFIKPLPAELAKPVGEAGETLIACIRRFNASSPEDDPHYQAAADASGLFSNWLQAQRALRDLANVDGLPQLKTILELARQRKDSEVMKSDVEEIAAHYVKEWSAAPVVAK